MAVTGPNATDPASVAAAIAAALPTFGEGTPARSYTGKYLGLKTVTRGATLIDNTAKLQSLMLSLEPGATIDLGPGESASIPARSRAGTRYAFAVSASSSAAFVPSPVGRFLPIRSQTRSRRRPVYPSSRTAPPLTIASTFSGRHAGYGLRISRSTARTISTSKPAAF